MMYTKRSPVRRRFVCCDIDAVAIVVMLQGEVME